MWKAAGGKGEPRGEGSGMAPGPGELQWLCRPMPLSQEDTQAAKLRLSASRGTACRAAARPPPPPGRSLGLRRRWRRALRAPGSAGKRRKRRCTRKRREKRSRGGGQIPRCPRLVPRQAGFRLCLAMAQEEARAQQRLRSSPPRLCAPQPGPTLSEAFERVPC